MNTDTRPKSLMRKMKLVEYVKNYKFNSLLLRNFIIITLLVLIPTLVVSVIYNVNTRRMVHEEIAVSNMNSLISSSDAIEAVMLELFYFSYYLSTNRDIFQFSISDRNEITRNQLTGKINDIIRMYTVTNNYIDSIFIYSEITNLVFHNSLIFDLDELSDKSWLPVYQAMGSRAFAIEATRKNDSYPYFITLICPLMYSGNEVKNGAVIININVEELGSIIGSSRNTGNDFFMVDENMRLYYSNDFRIMGSDYAPEYLFFLKDMPHTISQTVNINGKETIVSSITSTRYPWRYVLLSPLTNYENQMAEINRFIITITIIYVFASIIVSFILTIKSFKPVHNIMATIEDLNIFEGDYIDKDKNGNEIKHITFLLQKTQEQHSNLKLELDDRIIKLNNAQMKALQYQIDPHFLYNTLDIINWMAIEKMNGENDVSVMISTLALLLRSSLERTSFLVTVQEEIEHTKLYAKILELKYKGALTLHWEIESEIAQCKIIKLSIQPLVENALYHGLKPQRYHGNIIVKGTLEGDTAVITVEDDGAGMTDEKCRDLNEQLNNEYQLDNNHIGIFNVNQRIKLLYGDEYGITVSNGKTCGFVVRVIFPQDIVFDI